MKILILANSYLPVLGGLQTVVHHLACALMAEGHRVTVITHRYPAKLAKIEILDGVQILRWRFLHPRLQWLRSRRWPLFWPALLTYPIVKLKLRRWIAAYQPDVINVHFPDHQVPYLVNMRLDGPRVYLSFHGDDIQRYVSGTARQKSHERQLQELQALLSKSDACIFCSHSLAAQAGRMAPSLVEKFHVIHNGIAPARFNLPDRHSETFGYIFAYGRLTWTKGFDLALDAFVKLVRVNQDVHLLLAGDGEEKERLLQRADQLGIKDRVHFLGRVSQTRVVSLIKGARLVVIPSRSESFGIVLLEVLACDKPVVATQVDGIVEIIDTLKQNNLQDQSLEGIRLAAADSESIFEAMQDVLQNCPSLAVSERVFAQFSWKKFESEYMELFRMHQVRTIEV